MQNYSTSAVLPFDEQEDSTTIQQLPTDPIEDNTMVANSAVAFQTLKIITVALFASAYSLSLPILIIVMENEFGTHENRSLEQKILAPLVPYLFLVACNSWLTWNNIGHRMNGRIDTDIQTPDNTFVQAPYHILIGLIANIPSFTNAFLTVYAGLSSVPAPLKIGAAISVGGLNYTTDLYTDVVAAFRKHVENKQAQNQKIAPFFKQKYAKSLDKHALLFGKILRELLPIVRGILWTRITTLGLASTLSSAIGDNAVASINPPIGIMVYWSVAYSTRFDLIQFGDNIKAAGKTFEIENIASCSPNTLIRLAGKVSNGQILVDILKKLKCSTRTSVNITLAFYALGVITILQQALHTYVSSAHSNSDSNEVLLVNYCIGDEQAAQVAPKFEIAIASAAVTLGIIGTFAKSAILHKYSIDREQRPPQFDVGNDDSIEPIERAILG